MENKYLYHWGVKGMKWGVRKSRRKTSKSDDYLRAKQLKKKRISQMSNAELKELNNRMQLENQYKNLKKQNVNSGRKFVQDVAYETAKNTASDYARKYMKAGISYVTSTMMKK